MRSNTKGIALARQLWAEIDYWLAHFAQDVPEQIKEMVRRVRDFAAWLNGEAELDDDLILPSLAVPPFVQQGDA